MGQFMSLLVRYHQQLKMQYGGLLNQDTRGAITDMLHCKSDATLVNQWHCGYCQHNPKALYQIMF